MFTGSELTELEEEPLSSRVRCFNNTVNNRCRCAQVRLRSASFGLVGDLSHMERTCKDQVEQNAEFELPVESVEVTINPSRGCAEKIDVPAAEHQFKNGGEIIQSKHDVGNLFGLGP